MRTRARRPHGARGTSRKMPSALEHLTEQQAIYLQIITNQEQHLSALRKQREIQLQLDPKYIEFRDSSERETEIRKQWHDEILKSDPLDNWHPDDNRSLQDVLSVEQLWGKWEYCAAYPNTTDFLKKATSFERSRSVVLYGSFFPTGEIVEEWRFEPLYTKEKEKKISVPERVWDVVKRRMLIDKFEEYGRDVGVLPSRMLRIMDISPAIAVILLASTPKNVVSNVLPFLERYLTFSNFGKASMQSIRSETMNSYIFEYHFAFYYVTKEPLEMHLAHTDVRKLRKFSSFCQRPDSDTPCRHIYEEQMSFILMGHGNDVYTCYQLGEKFFNGPKPDEYRTFVHSPTWTPSTMFLSWIAMALHHVGIRWQDAIAAVDAQIASEEAVVFHQIDSFDLDSGAKDLKISQLRVYFWALEAYKLFEETLEATVDAWEQFKCRSLAKVCDGRNPEDYSKSVELIELSIARLRGKIERIRKKSDQVLRLRDGVFYTQSMSDTSVSIMQGEHIRLLTYFSILFLPLSFSTSIFGMQVLPQKTSMKAFGIVLTIITASTIIAVLVLAGAPQRARNALSKNILSLEQKLRKVVLDRPGKRWGSEPGERLSLCTYLAFSAELCLIRIPVYEVERAVDIYGFRTRRPASSNRPGSSMSRRYLLSNTTTLVSTPTQDMSDANPRSRARQMIEVVQAENQSSRQGLIPVIVWNALTALSIIIRILLLCVWVPLLLLEYVVLLFCCPFMKDTSESTQPDSQPRISKRERLKSIFTAPFVFLDLNFSLSPTHRKDTEHQNSWPGREPPLRGAPRLRRAVRRPEFQAAYHRQSPSGPSLEAAQPQLEPPPSVHLRHDGYSHVQQDVSRHVGGLWTDFERESTGVYTRWG